MSDANLMQLAYAAESTYKTAPTGSYTKVRYVSESLRQDTSTTISQEVRSDRMTADIIRTGIRASGDVSIEISYGAYDDLFESAFFDTWTTTDDSAVTNNTGISISSGAMAAASGLDVFAANDMVRVSGFTGAAASNNGVYVVATAAATSLTVVGGFPVDVAAGDSVTVAEPVDILSNGTTSKSFTFEKYFTDLSNEFVLLPGMIVDGFSMSITPDAIMTGGFTFLGGYEDSATSSPGSGYTNAPTNSVMNAIDNVVAVVEGTTRLGITNFSMQMQNNLRERLQVATLGAVSIGSGQINITGTLQAYFTSKTIMDKYRDFTTSSLILGFTDAEGNSYLLQLPSVKFTAGQQVAGGINTDIIADLQFSAKLDSTLSKMVRIGRWAA